MTSPSPDRAPERRRLEPAWVAVAAGNGEAALIAQNHAAKILAGEEFRIRPTVGPTATLGVLTNPANAHLFIVAADTITLAWVTAHHILLAPVVLIDDLEAAADQWTREPGRSHCKRLRAGSDHHVLDTARRTAERAWWSVGGGVTDTRRRDVLATLHVPTRILDMVKQPKEQSI